MTAPDEDRSECCAVELAPEGWSTYQYHRTCGACGAAFRSNHCPHDGVQKPCPWCGWLAPGERTPLQFLGLVPSPPD